MTIEEKVEEQDRQVQQLRGRLAAEIASLSSYLTSHIDAVNDRARRLNPCGIIQGRALDIDQLVAQVCQAERALALLKVGI